MAREVQDWQDDDTQVMLLRKVLRALLAPLLGWGAISTRAFQSSATPSSFAAITTPADITLAAGEKLRIKNLDTDALFVKRGTGATSSSFNYVLRGGTAPDDGQGGEVVIDDYVGVVSFAGTTPRYSAWK